MIWGATALLALIAHATTGVAALGAARPQPAIDTVISLERGPCERRCAVYRVTLYGDGRAVYIGQHFVRKTGTVKARVKPAAIHQIVQQFEVLNFFELKDVYGAAAEDCIERHDDAPPAELTLTIQGRTKTVRHSVGCLGPITSRLTELAAAIDHLVGTRLWVK
jgi:hypothetical protein